ncbi:serine/threonine protein kinase [Gemmata sp. G18]|uniref:Serine/threonine protein kinase n=1 Tax=Gemmata palustris TaxID=2822762 RepID=A0ABS5BLI4_9BACT|nr:serine/threonine-protein kinase [Gemmata palustris]MBP3953758.1 serine/threonine protein kinase [Gemmata palustris]
MTDETLFIAALEKPTPAERRAFLDQACGGDAALRERVARLLAGHDRATGILDHSLAPPDTEEPSDRADPPTERAGAVLDGRYKLLEEVGAGGMGAVWVAEQTQPVRRKVAIKLVKAGMDSKSVLARFEAERQALAVMNHPNIAKVFDGGTTDAGRPYFVMEYVKGVPLTAYCDDARLSVADRLALFVPVCQAVQHAHQKGIVHRDLKPSNILVCLYDGVPVPKVIDFGLAKALHEPLTEHTLHTAHGQMLGTPLYMSPEQAEFNNLDVDTRADVYALGVILYELLTGTTPLERDRLRRTPWDEMLRLIREEEPPRPSVRLSGGGSLPGVAAKRRLEPVRLTKLVRGELDWIVMKCLEKERGRRYETANGLARDVERYLADEPVEACPPSAAYRLRKMARKYRKALATLGTFAVLLLAATGVSVGLASWAIRERNHADQQKQTAQDQKRVAEVNFNRAVEAVDRMLTHVGEDKLARVPQAESIRRDLLRDALRFYRQFLAERADDPVLRIETAHAYERVALILFELGPRDECEEVCRQALDLLEKLSAGAPDDPELTHKRAGVHALFGLLHNELERFPQAERSYRQAVSLWEELGRRHPEHRKARAALSTALSNLIAVYRNTGALDDAVAAFEKCRATLDDLLTTDPENAAGYREHLAMCHHNVALVYAAQDKGSLAEEAHRKALGIYQQFLRDQPDSVKFQKQVARASNNLALFYSRNNHHEKADPLYRQSLDAHEALARDYPSVVGFAYEAAGSYGNMATHVRKTRSAGESLEWSDKAIRTAESVLERNSTSAPARLTLFNALFERALAYDKLERAEDATKDRKRMLGVSEGQSHITMRLFRPSPLARLGEHAKAAAEINALVTEGHTQGRNLYIFSYVLSVCSAAAGTDDRLPAGERGQLAEEYGGRAVELLRQYAAAGNFKDPDRLARVKANKDFAPISSRDDFKTLLAEWDKNLPKPEVLPAPRTGK